jgi:hypothetical protein
MMGARGRGGKVTCTQCGKVCTRGGPYANYVKACSKSVVEEEKQVEVDIAGDLYYDDDNEEVVGEAVMLDIGDDAQEEDYYFAGEEDGEERGFPMFAAPRSHDNISSLYRAQEMMGAIGRVVKLDCVHLLLLETMWGPTCNLVRQVNIL